MICDTFSKLVDAYAASTSNDNRFKKAVHSIEWTETFTCDDGMTECYVNDELSLDVYKMDDFGKIEAVVSTPDLLHMVDLNDYLKGDYKRGVMGWF